MSPQALFQSLDERIRGIRKHTLARNAVSLVLLPIEFILSLPLYLVRIRALRISVLGRIGHLAAEPDIFIKIRLLGLRRWNSGVIISPPGDAANECLLDYWSRYFRVIRYPFGPGSWPGFIEFRISSTM
jgi:hypothetical protein